MHFILVYNTTCTKDTLEVYDTLYMKVWKQGFASAMDEV